MKWIWPVIALSAMTAVALLTPRTGLRQVVRADSALPAARLGPCLAARLGLGPWKGNPQVAGNKGAGLRAELADKGASRHLSLLTEGGRPLSSGESEAVQACLRGG
ncbi:hypothetical protein Y88_2336 [Novosphingobium nitrogenifigens DSM 19370]|uniref:Uncharacterized protein n=1 Tax=Novosphingobium nitrogenifigens DSM 19370 TaxID=983920 RepID=F1Z6B5_9SPHN|nr:hypothetical protein Y88_2336 [Novosphingobium nitrogenifigens DSM 19370]